MCHTLEKGVLAVAAFSELVFGCPGWARSRPTEAGSSTLTLLVLEHSGIRLVLTQSTKTTYRKHVDHLESCHVVRILLEMGLRRRMVRKGTTS
jgi:hypothetical protein